MKKKTPNTQDENHKTVQLNGEEYIIISDIAKTFLDKGISDNPPNFAVVMGGVGAGKTTIRRQQFSNGYVHFEFGEISTAVRKVVGESNPKLTDLVGVACNMILRESIQGRKNIVTEIIGDNEAVVNPVLDKMHKIGYECSVQFVDCDPAVAHERHVKAVEENKDYVSAYFTQEATLSHFYHQLDLGRTPVPRKKEEPAEAESRTQSSRVRITLMPTYKPKKKK